MLLQNLRAKIGARLSGKSEDGFTLIELLVVMLILGILAAIALPAFFNQQDKAGDAESKSIARTAQTAIETVATDANGSYAAADDDNEGVGALTAVEPSLTDAEEDIAIAADENSYTITVTSDTDNTFSIQREADGQLTFDCTVTSSNRGGCPGSGEEDGEWD